MRKRSNSPRTRNAPQNPIQSANSRERNGLRLPTPPDLRRERPGEVPANLADATHDVRYCNALASVTRFILVIQHIIVPRMQQRGRGAPRTSSTLRARAQPAVHELPQQHPGRHDALAHLSSTEQLVQHSFRLRRSTPHHAEPKHPTTLRAATLINRQIPAATARSESEYWLTSLPGQAVIGVNDSCRLTMLTLGGSGHGTSFPTGGADIPRARLAGWPMLIRGPVGRSGTA